MSQAKRRGRREFSAEFKAEAVELMQRRLADGMGLAQVGRELELDPDLLRRWARELGQWKDFHAKDLTSLSPEQELKELRRENEILRQERDFLKKATAFFAKESR